jgi:hypothetical protein
VGAGGGGESNVQYRALLRRRDGSITEIKPYGVDKITGNASSLNLSKAKALFPFAARELESPAGPIQLLIGMDHMEEAPREEDRAQGVALYRSRFGTGYVAGGNMGYQLSHQHRVGPPVKVLSCRTGLFNPPEFIPAEAMGTEVPRRCPACRNCKECQFRMDSLTFKENEEYEVLLSKLRLDVERKKWIAGYPFNTMVERLIDNYNQSRGFMSRMEARLLKSGRLEEFNRQFQDNVDRGVFRPIPKGEADQYKGAVNYISMVEAFKTSPHAPTLLRICMNSSMKQPKPSGVSLNDCLLKGPPALADLYTVTLGIREHKVAFTKDISKFYQCVEADEAAHHVRRILWKFGERTREPTIFVTTRVNYGDRPAGCIAIAAVRETATRFGEGKEKAAWFLKNRTFVDDATGGAGSVEAAKQVSQDMEDILENGGFRFKETVMSGDPLGKDGELRKVLGLRRDTQRDKICVDINLNYGEKVKGAYLEEDALLTDPESALPRVITRRVLWRVAQSQYDPLGLLSVYMVKWKLLMRKATLKGKEGGWETPLDKEEEEEFRQLLRDLKELREIRFPRCVQPLEGQFKNPMLMVFGDGSREACCTLVYLRWESGDGTARCCLVTRKTQVAPRVKITIPRMELVAAVNSVRLAKKAREALKIPIVGTRYFTDSSAVLGMLRTGWCGWNPASSTSLWGPG